jgi:CheY-like chemotaxis protein
MNVCTKTEQCRVLLIEDYPDHAELVKVVIQQYGKDGFTLCHHTTLAEGLVCIGERDAGPIDVILLDLHLPDSVGMPTLEAVVAAAKDVPIVVMTSIDDESLAETAIEKGAQDYVTKTDIMAGSRSLERIMRYSIARYRVKKRSKEQERKLALAETGLEDSNALRLIREVKEELAQIAEQGC